MRSQASDYLDRMFGTKSGHVYMAFKAQDESWSEHSFAWPAQRRSLMTWTRNHADSNLFIVPALRGSQARRKGDGISLQWLWADVDWEKVPADKREAIRRRIDQMGTYVVASGTQSAAGVNVHVYVRLTREVDVEHHYRLNTGLRDYLLADNKQADNSFLRLPGTTNWKTRRGRPVEVRGGHGKSFRPEAFNKIRAFQNAAKVAASGDTAWTRVDVPVKARRILRIDTDEARARYGTRHEAVWAVIGDMMRWGFTDDQIHTVMDDFPPAIDKAEEERGYDVHRDVAKRLARRDEAIEHAKAIVDGTDDHDHGSPDGDDSPFQILSDEEVIALGPANPLVQKILARRAAQREAEQWEQQQHFMAPPDDVSWNAAVALTNPPEPMPYLIGPRDGGKRGIAGAHHNVLITAQYKTGKTAFTLATLAKSLCDGTSFLGEFEVPTEGRVVGHWNCEMEGNELLDDYVRPAGINHPERLHVANLRGYAVNILSKVGKAWTVNWLKDRGVQVWTIDSLARVLRMAGVKEQENDQVLNVLMAIDEIKVEAGVDVTFVIAHTGRAEMEEGRERARGATVIDDWADARWVMTAQDGVRFLAVTGRGVDMPTTSLDFNADTQVSTLGSGGKADVRETGEVQAVISVVKDNPGCTREVVVTKLRERGVPKSRCVDVVRETAELGFIEIRRTPTGHGGNPRQNFYPVSEGPVNGGASKRRVDFSRVDEVFRGRKRG